jgi:hypothetical protein
MYSLNSHGEAQIHGMHVGQSCTGTVCKQYAEKFGAVRNLFGGTLRNW